MNHHTTTTLQTTEATIATRSIATRALATTATIATLTALTACVLADAVGGMAESFRLTGTTEFPAEYTGLEDKTWAVVTLAPRGVQAEIPNVITVVTNASTRKLVNAQNLGTLNSAGYQPPDSTLLLQRTNPSFGAWTYDEMAEQLDVERLIVVDIAHLQLYERGNSYLWDGAIAARLGVVEADTGAADFAFQKDITIAYPDSSGFNTDDFAESHVVNTLLDRLTNRVAWSFHVHEVPNTIEY